MALKDPAPKSLFKSHKPQLQDTEVDITKVLTVDSQVINFGKFISGKILGSTLGLANIAESE